MDLSSDEGTRVDLDEVVVDSEPRRRHSLSLVSIRVFSPSRNTLNLPVNVDLSIAELELLARS